MRTMIVFLILLLVTISTISYAKINDFNQILGEAIEEGMRVNEALSDFNRENIDPNYADQIGFLRRSNKKLKNISSKNIESQLVEVKNTESKAENKIDSKLDGNVEADKNSLVVQNN